MGGVKYRCFAPVADHTGYHFHKCGRAAKYFVDIAGRIEPRCGIHAKGPIKRGRAYVPVTEQPDAGEGEKP